MDLPISVVGCRSPSYEIALVHVRFLYASQSGRIKLPVSLSSFSELVTRNSRLNTGSFSIDVHKLTKRSGVTSCFVILLIMKVLYVQM